MLTVRVAMLAGLVASLAVPVLAQTNLASQAAPRPGQAIAFFERAKIGPLEVTPIGVIRDQRCSDPRFCYRPQDMRISVIVYADGIMEEAVLRLGIPTKVPGGYFTLVDPGTRSRDRSALRLDEYRLDIRYAPAIERDR